MLANFLAAQLYSAPVWPSAANQRMTSNCCGLRSAADVISLGRLAVADCGWCAINKSVSAVSTELQILSNALLHCTWCWHTFSMLNAVDKYLIRLFTDKLERSWWRLSNRHNADNVEPLQLPQSLTSLLSSSNQQPSDHTPMVWTSLLYNYVLTSSPTYRWLRGSVNPSPCTLCRWPRGSDHVSPSSTYLLRHGLLMPLRDPSLHPLPRGRLPAVNDDKLVPASTVS